MHDGSPCGVFTDGDRDAGCLVGSKKGLLPPPPPASLLVQPIHSVARSQFSQILIFSLDSGWPLTRGQVHLHFIFLQALRWSGTAGNSWGLFTPSSAAETPVTVGSLVPSPPHPFSPQGPFLLWDQGSV